MPLLAAVFPIAPGKTDDWRAWIAELNGPRFEEFAQSRRSAGIHERTFLQSTPMGDLVIATFEGNDPAASFGQLLQRTDEFSRWFIAHATEVHGFDMTALPPGPPSELVADSERAIVPVG